MARTLTARIPGALAALALAAAALPAHSQEARAFGRSQPIPGRYIVVYKDGVADPVAESERAVRNAGGRRHHAYSRALKGFAATLSEDAVQRLRADPDVAYIEQDHTISVSDVQDQATWGLDRIDQADRPLDTQYHYNGSGAGAFAFIIDTGIRADHGEFTGRIVPGHSTVSDGRGTADCNGHGTHVAGTVGGITYGVAKQVSLVPVRVLGCDGSGTWSGVIAGVDWVAGQTSLRPAVANMSLGGSRSTALNAAVARAVAANVTMVVAAGNENTNACTKSPASEPSAITVGATTSNDARASFSNYGDCVDIFAPGAAITSAWHTGASATNTISGTSMATPHVAGVAALVLAANPAASPAAVGKFLIDHATTGKLASLNTGSPNRLLYSLAQGAPTEPPPVAMAVRSIAGTALRVARQQWRGQATITVRNMVTGDNVEGAVVGGSFAPGGTGQCTTTRTGSCVITSATIPSTTGSTVFTVTGITGGGGLVYDAAQNAATQVTILKR